MSPAPANDIFSVPPPEMASLRGRWESDTVEGGIAIAADESDSGRRLSVQHPGL
jgi:hypothetical protein